MSKYHLLPGQSYPLGATFEHKGVNFCLYSKNATGVELLLFDEPNAPQPTRIIRLNPKSNKTFYYWHIFVCGLKAGQIYAYRVHGHFQPETGQRFDGTKVLLDPYAKAIIGQEYYSREAAIAPGDNCSQALKSVVIDTSSYDWEGDKPLGIPYHKTIIYELHVGGFSSHINSGVSSTKRGTYAGLIEKIPYLQQLGITAVEVLPIHEFDPQDAPPEVTNYWGYSTLSFFAPHRAYSSRQDRFGAVDEFRDLVKALHKAGIEIILDVVFNHSAEGNDKGPTLSFKGIENETYYILNQNNLAEYQNYSGCGNTLKSHHPIMSRLILDSLRYWVSEMHVDGFRFDLASVMSRDDQGQPVKNPLIPWAIESEPILANTKIIAEAWDAGGLYQVGSFSQDRFAEWNGPFRDDVRRFFRADPHTIKPFANRIIGSPDIYHRYLRQDKHSINFITCHDGFTLNDLVSYNHKHNEDNHEDNIDGTNHNFSWNCGWEGEIKDPGIEALRKRQIKNFWTTLLISQGTPMILMGDEVRRTQKGNNNAYCQNNPLSWFDWNLVAENADIFRFAQGVIHFIKEKNVFGLEKHLSTIEGNDPYIVWHGVNLYQQYWEENSHSLAFELCHPAEKEHFFIILNAYWECLNFDLPLLPHPQSWRRIIDTTLPPPWDFCYGESAPIIKTSKYQCAAHSCVLLMAS